MRDARAKLRKSALLICGKRRDFGDAAGLTAKDLKQRGIKGVTGEDGSLVQTCTLGMQHARRKVFGAARRRRGT